MDMQNSNSNKKSMISVSFQDKNALYQAYMPFLRNGGIFVKTEYDYEMGDSVFIRLTLPEDGTTIPVASKVVWLNGNVGKISSKGIGLHFMEEDGHAKNKIENFLAGSLNGDKSTLTM